MARTRADYDDLFREMVLPLEGGYTPQHTNRSGRVVDPETLFGVTIDNWVDYLRAMPASALTGLSPEILRRVQDIRSAANEASATTLTRDLLRYAGGMLRAVERDTNAGDGIPPRSNHLRRDGLSADQQRDVASMQGLTFNIYHERFVVEPGFDRFPDYIIPYLVDFGLNGGPARARWALSKAMREAGLFSEGTEAENEAVWRGEFPYLTSGQANDRSIFGRGQAGAAYGGTGLNDDLIARLTAPDVTDQQRANVLSRFNTWRLVYYRTLANESPSHARYLRGWTNRTGDMQDYIEENWESGLPDAWPGSLIVATMDVPLEEREALERRIAGAATPELRREIVVEAALEEESEPEPAPVAPPVVTQRPDVVSPPVSTSYNAPVLGDDFSYDGEEFAARIIEAFPRTDISPLASITLEDHIHLLGEVMADMDYQLINSEIDLLTAQIEMGQVSVDNISRPERFRLVDLLGTVHNQRDRNPGNNSFTPNERLAFYPEGSFRNALADVLDRYYRDNLTTRTMEEFDPAMLGNLIVNVYTVGDRHYVMIDQPTTIR